PSRRPCWASRASTSTPSPAGRSTARGRSSMSTHRSALAAAALALALAAGVAFAESPNLGKPIDPADIAPWDISILPDGTGLPSGQGTAAEGAPIYKQKCAACHGENGEGGIAGQLIGGPPRATLDGGKTIANFYPYATTIFDYVRRAMPYT